MINLIEVIIIFCISQTVIGNTELLTWCTFNSLDFKKCQDLSHDFISVAYKPIMCREEPNIDECVQYVSSTPQAMMIIDAGHLYHAQRREKRFKIVLAENNGISKIWLNTLKYYSVAVIKAGNRHLELLYLKNKKICHGDYDINSSTGWDLPLSLLSYYDELVLDSRCDIVDGINRYFGISCLPTSARVIGDTMRTCQACSSGTCSRETLYRGPAGPLRCLADGAGDVAFLRHDTIFKYADGKSGEDWSVDLKTRDYRLLCPDGSQTSVENYESCYAGIMMPNTLVINGNASDKSISEIQLELTNPPPQVKKYIFDSSPYSASSTGVLFSDDTVELVAVKGDNQYPRNFLGQFGDRENPSYLRTMDSLYCNAAYVPAVHTLVVLVLLTMSTL